MFASENFEEDEQINIEDPNHEQKDGQEALFSQNGRPSEILSKIEH